MVRVPQKRKLIEEVRPAAVALAQPDANGAAAPEEPASGGKKKKKRKAEAADPPAADSQAATDLLAATSQLPGVPAMLLHGLCVVGRAGIEVLHVCVISLTSALCRSQRRAC